MFAIPLLLMAFVASAHATTMQRFALAELADNAEHIVVATCQKVEPELVHGNIYTRYSFLVSETVKGDKEQTLTLHLPGGQFQGINSRIAGMPVFARGDEAVLFLTIENQLGHAWPVGLGQGAFRIERHADHDARVYQNLDGLSFYETAAKRATTAQPVQGAELGAFLDRLRALGKASTDAR